MTRTAKLLQISAAAGFALAALLWSGHGPTNGARSLLATAEARIGRPMTPMSYAGVARRTTRRAVAVGAAGAGAYGYSSGSGCAQVTNAYGQLVTVCE